MTDSALGESTVTSPVIGHSADTICGDGVQLLSPNRGRDWPIFIIDIYHFIDTVDSFLIIPCHSLIRWNK